MNNIRKFKLKKFDIGFLGFLVASICFLFLDKGIIPIILTIIGTVLFVYFIDKDITPVKKHNK